MGPCHQRQHTLHQQRREQLKQQQEITLEPIQVTIKPDYYKQGSLTMAPSHPLPQNPFRRTHSLNQPKCEIYDELTGTKEGLSDSLRHMESYTHVLYVRPPSELEDSNKIAGLEDSTKIWELINPEVRLSDETRKIKTSGEKFVCSLQEIREQRKVNEYVK